MSIPVTTRLAIEIPKPKDWQAFQRNCVLLFRSELNDPHAQEYGRPGQKQGGIDILACREGQKDRAVGIQCRLIAEPLKEKKILSDAREALELNLDLKELIFATTAPDDTGVANAAIAVSNALAAEGKNIRIVVYGWTQLQTLIALHDVAYTAFHPSSVSSLTLQTPTLSTREPELASLVAEKVVQQLQSRGFLPEPQEVRGKEAEDSALHARIDTFRDLIKEGEILISKKGLSAIQEKENLSGKPWALFRIKTNLASIALELGREDEAASLYEEAHALFPDDPTSLSNLAFARTIRGEYGAAMDAAHMALHRDPKCGQAVCYLLQAAARSEWAGEPEDLVPPGFDGEAVVDIGVAEFIRRRALPNWAERSLALARRHPSRAEFKKIKALSVLTLALGSNVVVPGGLGPVSSADLNEAADEMKAMAERCLSIGFEDQDDLKSYLNNAAALLRLCERHGEVEALLRLGARIVPSDPQLRRLLALSQIALGKEHEISILDGDKDPENSILRAHVRISKGDYSGALSEGQAISTDLLPTRLRRLRLKVIGEAALKLRRSDVIESAVAGLREIDPEDIEASLLEIRGERKSIEDEEKCQNRLRQLAADMGPDVDEVKRFLVATELVKSDLPDEASRLLEGRVDLTRRSPMATLLFEALAKSRRDVAFIETLESASSDVQNDPEMLWMTAAHAWNLGDLEKSLSAAERILVVRPDEPKARLLKVEILVRQDRSKELLDELERPLERLLWRKPQDQFRLASLLGYFGFTERAAALAYRLFLQHRDLSIAWMTLSSLVLDEGRGDEHRSKMWVPKVAGEDTAIDVQYDEGEKAFFVIEPDDGLRKLDPASWETDHALVKAVFGLTEGARFTTHDGRQGKVVRIRHKYVARLHFVLKNYGQRFPQGTGFKRIPLNPDQPGGLDGLISEIRARHDWIKDAENQYIESPVPLGLFAHRVGGDTIEVAASLVEGGKKIRVSSGAHVDRNEAIKAVVLNGRKGAAFDLFTFWTAWRLKLLDVIQSVSGDIHLPQSVLDRLRARREKLDYSSRDGHKSASYDELSGRVVLHEIPPEHMAKLRDEVDQAILWAEDNAVAKPVSIPDNLPIEIRDFLRRGKLDVFDGVMLSKQADILFLSDDLPTRGVHRLIGGNGGAWTHVILGSALDSGLIDLNRYVRSTSDLIAAGHSYLGVSGAVLAIAARLDALEGDVPGRFLRALGSVIGGKSAEPFSHARAVLHAIDLIWRDSGLVNCREAVTGHLLNRLISERQDAVDILRVVWFELQQGGRAWSYMSRWLRGHFLLDVVLKGGDLKGGDRRQAHS